MISLWMVRKSCTTKLGCFFNISHGMFTINWCRISLAHPQSLSLYIYIIFPWYSTLFLYYPSMIPFPRRYHHFRWEPLGSSDSIASWADRSWQSPVECNWRPGATAWVEWSIDLSIDLSLYIYIFCIYDYMYIFVIYIYTCMYISILDDVYVRNNSLGGEMHGIPCGTAICWVVSVRVFRTLRACKIWFYLRLIAFLRLPKTVPKLPFEAYLKDILCNLQCFEPLTETSTSRKTLQEPQTNLTLNN